MKEHFAWNDPDGNNGYYYDRFTPAELQAIWELQGMPHIQWNEETPRSGRLKVILDHRGQPTTEFIPNKIDAKTIEAAIKVRAKLIKQSGNINPPTIEQIRESILVGLNK